MKLKVMQANGIRFTAYVRGSGPRLVLVLHGFPDDAAGMIPLLEAWPVEELGWTVAAPYLRGYGPTGRAPDRRYLYKDLGRDVLALISAWGRETAMVVGHDWGAISGYAAAHLAPERVDALVALSVPPPRVFARGLVRHPTQWWASSYVLALQSPWGLKLLEAGDYALVEALWRRWSPGWSWSESRLAKVKHTLSRRGTARAALRYYRGLLEDAALNPGPWRESMGLASRPLEVPTLVLHGADDGCVRPVTFEGLGRGFAPGVAWESRCLEGAGHFLVQERTGEVAAEVLAFSRRFF